MRVYGKLMISCVIGVVLCALVGCAKKTSDGSSVPGASQINASACAGNVYLEKYNCSLDTIQQAALTGNPDAQYALGYMYYNGIGTVKDQKTGVLWIERSAQLGQPLAQQAQSMIEADQKVLPSEKTAVAQADPRLASGSSPKVAVKNNSSTTLKSSSNSLAGNKSHYAIQLMGSYDKPSIQSFIARSSLSDQAHIVEATFHGKPWFTLMYGDYRSMNEAKSALAELPQQLQQLKPWVKAYNITSGAPIAQQTT